MGQKICFFLLLLLFASACSFQNAEPELSDPIYSDIVKESRGIDSQLVAAQKELDGFLVDLEAVKPQTGQIKYAQKHISDAEQNLEHLRQMSQYWKLRVSSRLAWDREHYLVSFKNKTPWPPPGEYKEFKAQVALENAPKNWNLRERLEQAKLGLKINGPAKKHDDDASPTEH